MKFLTGLHKMSAPALTGIFFIVLISIFADFLASPVPVFVFHNASGEQIPASPLFDSVFKKGRQSYENLHFRDLAREGKIRAVFPLVAHSPYEPSLNEILVPPSGGRFGHYMGTDNLGRDVASRMIHGARNSIFVGFIAVGIAFVLGILIGSIAGYAGGWLDLLMSRLIEVVIVFPTLILIMAVLALLKPSLINIMVVIGLTGWTGIARTVRGEFLRRREDDYVVAARLFGASHFRLIFVHILPNSMAPVLVLAAFGIAGAVLTESALSFLGIGVPAPEPSWGDVLKVAQSYPDIAWWLAFFPGFFIFLTVVSLNILGEDLRRILSPR